jgi:mannose-6-phosphate isomerase-like protein (cupin superfamily)
MATPARARPLPTARSFYTLAPMSANYTKKHLLDVKDGAIDFGIGDRQEARFPAQDLDCEETGLALHRVRPGQKQGFAHRHEAAEEVHVILSGSGTVELDGERVELAPMDGLRISPKVTRVFEAGPEGLEYLVFGPRREGDGEIVKE